MSAKKKKPEAPKKGKGAGKSEEDRLTYARIPVNMRKTDYEALVEYEKENGFFNHADVVRRFVLEKLKAWREEKKAKGQSDTPSAS